MRTLRTGEILRSEDAQYDAIRILLECSCLTIVESLLKPCSTEIDRAFGEIDFSDE